jgi:hypothetical protein
VKPTFDNCQDFLKRARKLGLNDEQRKSALRKIMLASVMNFGKKLAEQGASEFQVMAAQFELIAELYRETDAEMKKVDALEKELAEKRANMVLVRRPKGDA